ncbi:LPS export ABC transporter periplasmic protein LptC [Ramlibacter sp.]|uniref:LPS export ABC transporter periplasmic protein LptC n=1 Tax=Ramlibacter sp. TaxID=1917967 RepID=UPI0017B191AB|nr:LPS export ABC transporter periplasmic protein LptC [Ramlibacter sp.]MBA2674567.1 LPS export ABC transporter periplasmic protein LptC [Ramlibacter sp.]
MSSVVPADVPPRRLARSLWRLWDRLSIYLPVMLMGVMALGTYWLARNTPSFSDPTTERAATHEPDSFMRGFSVKNFDAAGRLKSEIYGVQARHYPDTDTLEIDQPRIRSFNEHGALTVATARRAISNADGTQVQLIGDAVVTREAVTDAQGNAAPKMEIRSDFLHAFMDTERITTNKPVILIRGDDRFNADGMDYDNLARVLQLRGRVRGLIASPRAGG